MEFKMMPVVTEEALASLIDVDEGFIDDKLFHYDFENGCYKPFNFHYTPDDKASLDENEKLIRKLCDKLQEIFPNDNYILVEIYW